MVRLHHQLIEGGLLHFTGIIPVDLRTGRGRDIYGSVFVAGKLRLRPRASNDIGIKLFLQRVLADGKISLHGRELCTA